jgi:hypothetical protein
VRSKSLVRFALGASVAGVLSAGQASLAESIDTTLSWNGISLIGSWSPTGSFTYGQVITPTKDGKLTDFTFYLNPESTSLPVNYRAYVYQWDYTGGPYAWGPTGPSLHDSGPLSFSGTPGIFSAVTTKTVGLALNAGTPYALFFSTVGEANSGPEYPGGWGWGYMSTDVYPGGDFIFSSNPSSYTAAWDSYLGQGRELAFKANINEDVPGNTAVPGPVPLFGAAAACGYSRKLRNRIKKSGNADSSTFTF